MESHDKEKPFKELLVKNKEITRYLREKEIDAALDPKNYIGTSVLQVEKVVKELG